MSLLGGAASALAALAPRGVGAGLRISAIERRLLQDPGDLRQRAAAIAHYSAEARAVLTSGRARHDDEARRSFEEPLGRAREHLEYVLGATDDIHRLYGVLTGAFGARLFYQLPEVTAQYMRKIGLHSECTEEFGTRSEFEERATPYHLANALAVLKAAGRSDAAKVLFDEAVSLEWNGRRPIRWQSLRQTPAVYIDNLEHRPYWDGPHRPALADLLEQHIDDIREDLRGLPRGRGLLEKLLPLSSSPGKAPNQVPAYPNLVEETGDGVWDMLQVFVNRQWNERACAMLPRLSKLLRDHLPSTDVPYIHYNTEEVVLFLLAPGSSVRLHNGGSNAPINIHFGISGCEGAHVEVGGEPRALRDGAAVVFDDGTDHRVWHTGADERWCLTVRMMHPQLARTPAPYFSRAFTRRTCFESWTERRHAELVSGGGGSGASREPTE